LRTEKISNLQNVSGAFKKFWIDRLRPCHAYSPCDCISYKGIGTGSEARRNQTPFEHRIDALRRANRDKLAQNTAAKTLIDLFTKACYRQIDASFTRQLIRQSTW
jgi:hypothetical protein